MAINRITTQSITDGTITAAKVAGDMATQAELDTKLNLSGGALTGALTTNSTVDGIDIATRDAVLTSTTNTAGAALPKGGGTMTGALSLNDVAQSIDFIQSGAINFDSNGDQTGRVLTIGSNRATGASGGTTNVTFNEDGTTAFTGAVTTNSTIDGRDVAADGVLATNALPKAGGTMTGNLTLSANMIGKSDHTTELGHYNNGLIKRIRMAQGGELHFGDTTTTNFLGLTEGAVNDFGDTDRLGLYYRNELKMYTNNNTLRFTMNAAGNATFSGTVSATATATLLIINSAGSTVKTINGIG